MRSGNRPRSCRDSVQFHIQPKAEMPSFGGFQHPKPEAAFLVCGALLGDLKVSPAGCAPLCSAARSAPVGSELCLAARAECFPGRLSCAAGSSTCTPFDRTKTPSQPEALRALPKAHRHTPGPEVKAVGIGSSLAATWQCKHAKRCPNSSIAWRPFSRCLGACGILGAKCRFAGNEA